MTKADCVSRGCPMLVKKKDPTTLKSTYVCSVVGKDVKKVHDCINKEH